MIVLADNDIVMKLASCDLYDEFLVAFDATRDDLRVLPTARYALMKGKRRKQLGDAVFARLVAFLQAVRDLDIAPDPDEMIALAEQPRIDSGEAVLFSTCPKLDGSLLCSGDKRSLTSLVEAARSDPACKKIAERLAGRVNCFEQIVLRILDRCGFDAVRAKLIAGRECDKTLAITVGTGLDATESALREGLESYVNDLRRTTGSLLQ